MLMMQGRSQRIAFQILFLVALAAGQRANSCARQFDCFDVTMEVVDSNVCGVGGGITRHLDEEHDMFASNETISRELNAGLASPCDWKVCMVWNFGKETCKKRPTQTMHNVCTRPTDYCSDAFDFSPGTLTSSVPNGHEECVIAKQNAKASFLTQDGKCNTKGAKTYPIEVDVPSASPVTSYALCTQKTLFTYVSDCNPSDKNGSDKECLWQFTTPPCPAEVTPEPSRSSSPSSIPSQSNIPSQSPSSSPTVSQIPSVSPSMKPSESAMPSISSAPTLTPSISLLPSTTPTKSAMPSISSAPTLTPSISLLPSTTPTKEPTPAPTRAPISPGPVETCEEQAPCLEVSIEPQYKGTCIQEGLECQFLVCLKIDLGRCGCYKDTDEIHHSCKKDENTCQPDSSQLPPGASFGGESSVQVDNLKTNHVQCQIAGPGTDVEFILKDGASCQAGTARVFGYGPAVCQPTLQESCSGGENVGAECLWTFTTPHECPVHTAVHRAPQHFLRH